MFSLKSWIRIRIINEYGSETLCLKDIYMSYLLFRANVTASSEWNERTAKDGWLHSGTAWSAKESDFSQYIMFDLGRVMNITAIVTQAGWWSRNFRAKCYFRFLKVFFKINLRNFAEIFNRKIKRCTKNCKNICCWCKRTNSIFFSL